MNHAALIKEIARGHRGSRALSRADSASLFDAALTGRLPEAALGALLVALRMKGETADELQGLADAWRALPEARVALPPECALPVVIGSYNGARRAPNLLPLFALLLARLGLRVLVHGPRDVQGRTASASILRALQVPIAEELDAVPGALAASRCCFVPLDVLSPALHRLLAWREVIGVRHLGHSFVKALNPCTDRALCLTGITHPPYRELLRAYFTATREDALLLRGHEGEAIASPRRLPPLDWYRGGELVELAGEESAADPVSCAIDAASTAEYTRRALADPRLLPSTLLAQARHVLLASGGVDDAAQAAARLHAVLSDIVR
ncbi:MAG: DNA-binding protein YbiB [Gammaproteobacteria bacterium]